MTFSIDTPIVIAISNNFDNHHDNSVQLLKLREDRLVLSLTVKKEAIETYIRKFKEASDNIFFLIRKTKKLTNFPDLFKQGIEQMIEEHERMANFYRYAYSLIEEHIEKKRYEDIGNIFKTHLAILGVLIIENVKDLKEYETVPLNEDMMKLAWHIESITSNIPFPMNKKEENKSEQEDRKHFTILCAYAKNNPLDYFTTDGNYFLWMMECLKIKIENNIEINPINLVEDYIHKLQGKLQEN